MNVLIINASPKRRGGASRFFSKLLKPMLSGCNVTVCDVRGEGDCGAALELLKTADAVVISSPLYVDGIPSSMLPFLIAAEKLCIEEKYHFKLYVMSNCGFIEGRQNETHLKMYEAWCARARITWGGGLGIGGGVILFVMYILLPIFAAKSVIELLVIALCGGVITGSKVWSSACGLLAPLFILAGQFIFEVVFAGVIRKGSTTKNLYIRPLLPSFVFLVVADIFMLLSALFKGTLPHKTFRRIENPTGEK